MQSEHYLGTTRILVEEAAERADKVPKIINTDYLRAYLGGIESAFGADTKHVQGKPFQIGNKNNLIERFHGTLKGRIKVFKGFKDMQTAQLLTDGWLLHYNFFKEHESLGNVPPAIKLGKVPFKDWDDVLDNEQVLPVVSPAKIQELRHVSKARRPAKAGRKIIRRAEPILTTMKGIRK